MYGTKKLKIVGLVSAIVLFNMFHRNVYFVLKHAKQMLLILLAIRNRNVDFAHAIEIFNRLVDIS